jgi:hypothetical protein
LSRDADAVVGRLVAGLAGAQQAGRPPVLAW